MAHARLVDLRKKYAMIEKIDSTSQVYKNLLNSLDLLDTPKLQLLAAARIRWVSIPARNRVIGRVIYQVMGLE